jgi:hypothetical protein
VTIVETSFSKASSDLAAESATSLPGTIKRKFSISTAAAAAASPE